MWNLIDKSNGYFRSTIFGITTTFDLKAQAIIDLFLQQVVGLLQIYTRIILYGIRLCLLFRSKKPGKITLRSKFMISLSAVTDGEGFWCSGIYLYASKPVVDKSSIFVLFMINYPISDYT